MIFYSSHSFTTGTWHAKESTPCQDFAITKIDADNNRAIAIVADGAGSRKFARDSAECAGLCLVDLFTSQKLNINSTKEFLLEQINSSLYHSGLPIQELGTTLLFVYVENNKGLYGHIGDGVILHGNDHGFSVLSLPQNDETSNQTYFVPTQDNSDEHFRVSVTTINTDTTFILCSDGISNLLYDPKTQKGAGACYKLANWNTNLTTTECNRAITSTLQNIFSKYSHDDLSIALLTIQK